LIDLFMELSAALDVMGRKPAAYPLGLQVGIEAFSKLLVLARIADEAGVELEGVPNQRFDVGDEVLWDACSPQEHFGDLAVRKVERVDPDG
jgi:hypothetical protein